MEIKPIDDLFTEEGLVVVIVDMQKKFLRDIELENVDVGKLVMNQIKILKKCKKYDVPVVLIEFLRKDDPSDTIKPVIRGIENLPKFKKIRKISMDGFTGCVIPGIPDNDLYKNLKDLGAKKLFFMGVFAGACVLLTALSAMKKGFEVASGPRYVAGFIAEHHFDSIYKCSGGVYI